MVYIVYRIHKNRKESSIYSVKNKIVTSFVDTQKTEINNAKNHRNKLFARIKGKSL